MPKVNLQSAVWKEGKFYVAQCLNVDISSFGTTKKEALKNLQEALELYFEGSKSIKMNQVQNAQFSKVSIAYA